MRTVLRNSLHPRASCCLRPGRRLHRACSFPPRYPRVNLQRSAPPRGSQLNKDARCEPIRSRAGPRSSGCSARQSRIARAISSVETGIRIVCRPASATSGMAVVFDDATAPPARHRLQDRQSETLGKTTGTRTGRRPRRTPPDRRLRTNPVRCTRPAITRMLKRARLARSFEDHVSLPTKTRRWVRCGMGPHPLPRRLAAIPAGSCAAVNRPRSARTDRECQISVPPRLAPCAGRWGETPMRRRCAPPPPCVHPNRNASEWPRGKNSLGVSTAAARSTVLRTVIFNWAARNRVKYWGCVPES